VIPRPRAITTTQGPGHVQCRIDWPCGCVLWLWRYRWTAPEVPWGVDRVHWCETHRRDTSMCARGGHAWEILHVFGRPTRPEAESLRCLHCGVTTTRTVVS